MTVSVFDVATYILAKTGKLPAMKLQKLIYYTQAWSLVWDDAPLFKEPIEAWANGPVVRSLFDLHKGKYFVEKQDIPGTKPPGFLPTARPTLTSAQIETIDSVLNFYGSKNSQWLSDLTHMEEPWKNARQGVPEGEPSDNEITLESMDRYYSSISPSEETTTVTCPTPQSTFNSPQQ